MEFDDPSSVFISTDVHGHLGGLETALMIAGHKAKKGQYVVLGGDSINGGPNSDGMIHFLDKENVFSVMGNHEAYVINLAKSICKKDFKIARNFLRGTTRHTTLKAAFNAPGNYVEDEKSLRVREKVCSWVSNGGSWFFTGKYSERQALISRLKAMRLPTAIELHFPQGRIGIVHGEVYKGDWDSFRKEVTPEAKYAAMWGRGFIAKYRDGLIKKSEISPVKNIDAVVLGHSSLGPTPVKLGNCWCMDVGAKRSGRPAVMRAKDIFDSMRKRKPLQRKEPKVEQMSAAFYDSIL